MAVKHGSSKKVLYKNSLFERKILRKIFGPTKEANVIWRNETNKELDESIKHRNIINYVKAQILSWFGYTNRMSETHSEKNTQLETIHRKAQVSLGR